MSGKSLGHHSGTQGRMRWYVVLGAAIILLAGAAGYYIGRQTEPAPTSDPPSSQKAARTVKRPQKAGPQASKATRPEKRSKKGWITRTTIAPDKHSTSSPTDQVQTETGTGSDPQMVVTQVVAALDDPNPQVRQEALERLESVDHPAVNAALSKAINDTDEDVRETAMDAMGAIGSPNVLDTLSEALSYGDEYMREAALEILEDIPDPRTVDLLLEKGLLNDNAEIQKDAFGALEAITDQEFTSYQEARQWWDQNQASFQFDE